MTGPEHYRKAEQLLDLLSKVEMNSPREPSLIAEAQVHATLALAAAVGGLDAAEGPGGGSATGRTANDGYGWLAIVDPVMTTPPSKADGAS